MYLYRYAESHSESEASANYSSGKQNVNVMGLNGAERMEKLKWSQIFIFLSCLFWISDIWLNMHMMSK